MQEWPVTWDCRVADRGNAGGSPRNSSRPNLKNEANTDRAAALGVPPGVSGTARARTARSSALTSSWTPARSSSPNSRSSARRRVAPPRSSSVGAKATDHVAWHDQKPHNLAYMGTSGATFTVQDISCAQVKIGMLAGCHSAYINVNTPTL